MAAGRGAPRVVPRRQEPDTAWFSATARLEGLAPNPTALHWMRLRDATLISVLAYAGLRPEEARGLRWGDVRHATLLVYSPKTHRVRPSRAIKLLRPLAADLRAWRLASGRPAGRQTVFPGEDRQPWGANAYAQWRSRVWCSALAEPSIEYRSPYALRHSFASLLAHEGRSLPYIAGQLGHSVAVCARTYAHVMVELEDAPKIPAEDAIRARAPAHGRKTDVSG